MAAAAHPTYPLLFSEWQIRSTPIANRVVFAPTCPTWVADPYEGVFTDQAVAYYEERARGGCGLIIIGGTIIHPEALYSEFNFPGLWKDDQVDGLARVADAVHRHGCKLAAQLLHPGLRAMPVLKKDPAHDFDADWYMVAPSQIPPGEYPNAPMPKELEEHEIQELLGAYADAARRAVAAGLDGVEYHMSHGYLPWQFLSPLYNHRTDGWGGSYEKRLRFPVESMRRVRDAIGDEAFLGYRINSTSFWPGDLEMEDVKRIVADLEREVDLDYVNLSAGVHHSYIHTPMTYEPGWERGYTKAVKEVSAKPVLLVGRITHPGVAEDILAAGEADAILLARQLFADPDWAVKARDGQADDIRRCVAANYCWRSVIRGGRVQCVYNAEVGRERKWGRGTLTPVAEPKKVVVIGGGPAGLEYARVASARGHDVVVLEREAETGGHVRTHALLPGRAEYAQIGKWLLRQATANGADVRTGAGVAADGLDALITAERPDHVVVATGSRYREDGWQGQTAAALPGAETGRCVAWDRVVTGEAVPSGSVLVVDDLQDANGPLTAVALADAGCTVRLVTRWPMVGMETIPEVYYLWIAEHLHRTEVEVITDHFVQRIDGASVELLNLYRPDRVRTVEADWIVMSTGRESLNGLYHALRARGTSVEMIGDAVAPRGTYEAVFEGHRAARKL
jgi:2,4-dienoyl-CoA reductase-like NADH-dependent reductase (Old Yellow Enzyme family)/pyruvate/2-oxoglutarate dehydrogenase complex dihydrolipoamide dehydrogenase (E3) component